MNHILFDFAGNPLSPTLVLANHSGNRLGSLSGIYDISYSDALTEAPEISFSITKINNGEENPIWDKIADIKLIHYLEADAWLQAQVELSHTDYLVKNVSGVGICRAELSQILLHGLEFNTEDDIARDDYEPSIIYHPTNANASILSAIFQKAPHYTIKHVDSSIASMQKTLEFDGVSIEDALNEISEECHCIAIYNNGTNPDTNMPAREVSLYDLEQICNDCGYRGEFTDACPKCGSSNIKYGYGNDTTIFISKNNLTDEITYTTDLESVKNCFKLLAGDDVMTSAIQACNPNGTDYIWFIPYELKQDMPVELVEKLESYDELFNYYQKEHVTVIEQDLIDKYNLLIEEYIPYNKDLHLITDNQIIGFPALMNLMYDIIDFNVFLESGLMPNGETPMETTPEEQAKKLTTESLSPIALSTVSEYSAVIVDQMVLAVARIIVDKRYDVKIKKSQFIYMEDADEGKKHRWVGSFTVTDYSDSTLTADTDDILIFINKDYDQYIRQRVEKILNDTDIDDFNISNLLSVDKSLEEFRESIKSYNINVLLSIKDACDTCLDTFQAESIGNQALWKDMLDVSGVDMYDKYYLNYYNKLEAVIDEVERKEHNQAIISEMQEYVSNVRDQIQDTLNFEDYLGRELWLIFCSYRREDIYKNDNYISDNLTNAEIFQNAIEFYETAQTELYKSATLQHSITSPLKNLLAIQEFAPLRDSFELGNWMRIEIDDQIYKLRLIKYTIEFNGLEEIKVEFSDVTKTADGITDLQDILKKQSSMSSSYGGVKRQAKQGKDSYVTVADWIENGLDATLTQIMDDKGVKDIVINKHGILIREYDEITESYNPEQMKIVNAVIAITTDNWKTIKTALGKFIYQNPITGEYINAYGLNGETIVGNLILGKQLGIYNDAANLSFDENGLWVYNDVSSFRVNPNSDILLSLSKDEEKMLWVDENGMLHIAGDGAGIDISANSSITGLHSEFKATADEIYAKVEDINNGLSSEISATADKIREEVKNTKEGLESVIEQTATDIRSEVTNYVDGLSSSIEQTAEDIRTEIKDTKEGLESSFSQTVDEIKTSVSDLDEGLNSKIDQTAEKIRQEVTDGDEKLQASIETTAEGVKAEAQSLFDGLSSTLETTAGEIRSDVQSKYEGLSSSIEQQAGQIESLVKADEGLSSRITQTYNDVHTEVENAKSGLQASIDVQADRITQEVTRATKEEESLSSRITQTADSLTSEIEKTTKMESTFNTRFEQTEQSFNSSVESLIVGSRNFAYHTSREWEDVVINNQENQRVLSAQIHIKNKGVQKGDTITVHFDVKFSADWKASGTGTKNSYVVVNKNPTGSEVNVSINNQKSQLEAIMGSAQKEGHISFSFSVTEDMLNATYSEYMLLYVRFDYYTGTFWWKNLMVEVGTKESAWLQAPEDINENFYDMQTHIKETASGIEILAKRADDSEAKIEANADKIQFLVSGEGGSSSFEITEEAMKLIAQEINLRGMITFSGLDNNAQTKVNASIVSATAYYKLSASDTTAPGKFDSGWGTFVNWSTVTNSSTNFVWQLIETKYGDGTISRTDPVCISDGKEIASVKTQYCLHTSDTSAPTSATWSDTLPDFQSGKFIWSRQYITYSDGSTKTTTPVYDSGLTKTNNSIQAAVSTGLHSVYYSDTAPSAPHVLGDVWYKTGTDAASGKRGIIGINVWVSPGQWQEYQSGSTTILNGTIVTDLIAANAVTADKIYAESLSAISADLGTITGGVLQSKDFQWTSGDTFATSGMQIGLYNGGYIISENFVLSSNGAAALRGRITATELIAQDSISIYRGSAVQKVIYYETDARTIRMGLVDSGNKFAGSAGFEFVGNSICVYGDSLTMYHGSISAIGGFIGDATSAGYLSGNFNITIGNAGMGFNNSFGKQDISFSLSQIGAAAANHTHYSIERNGVSVSVGSSGNTFLPSTNGNMYLGFTGYLWNAVYAKNGSIQTSDERKKNILGGFDERHKDLFMKSHPIMFKWDDDSGDNKIHWGLGAQSFEKAIVDSGLKDYDFASLDYNAEYDSYGMAYTEAQMLAWYVTQENTKDIESLKKDNELLRKEIAEIKKQLQNVI